MKEKFVKFLKSNVFFYNSLALCAIAAIFEYLNVGFCDDERLNKLIIDLLPRFFACLFLISAALSLEVKCVGDSFFKCFLWAVPAFFVAVANFPFSALINGGAIVDRLDLIWLVIVKCFLVATTEELFFRGVLIAIIKQRVSGNMRILKTVLFSSLIFGAWHLVNIFSGANFGATALQVVYTFLIGAMLAIVYLKTENLFISIFIHALFNLGGMLILDAGQGNPQDLIFWILTIVIGVLVGVYMFVSLLRMEKANRNNFDDLEKVE